MKQSFWKRETAWLALIVLVGMALRIAFVAMPRMVRWDEAAYQMIAHNLLTGQGYAELVGPARDIHTPPMLALISLVGLWLGLPMTWVTAGIAHVLFGGLLPIPMYVLARGIYGPRVGLIAALLAALYPTLAVNPLYWSTMTEPVYLFFVFCGLFSAWRAAHTGQWRWVAGVGLACGLAYLTRPEALAYLVVMAFFIVVFRWRASSRVRALGMATTAIALFLLLASPYLIYLHHHTGRWIFSGKQTISINIAWAYVNRSQAMHDLATAALDSTGQEIVWLSLEQFESDLGDWIMANPRRFIGQVRFNIRETWRALFHQELFSVGMIALMALGLAGRPWTRHRARGELLLFLALAPLAGLWLYWVVSRFLAFIVPIGLLWAAVGLDHLLDWVTAQVGDVSGPQPALWLMRWVHGLGRSTIVRALPLAVTVVALLATDVGVMRREIAMQPFWRGEVAQWLVEHVPPGSPIMTRNSEIALYAGLPMVAFPNAEWPQVLAYGQARGAAYLVVEDREIREIRPQHSILLETTDQHPLPGLTLIARLPGPGRETLVFAFDKAP